MGKIPLAIVVLAVTSLALAAPPLVSVGKGGEVGVNFGGYHASAGLGGLLSGGGVGGLHAEAGTPHGQEARAGLGGSISENSSQGGLYAGATAGGGVKAAAGLEGATSAGGSAGAAYSGAQAGGHSASAGLGGESSGGGGGGFSFSAHKSVGYAGGATSGGAVVKEVDVAPVVVEKSVVHSAPSHGVSKHKKVTTYEEESVNYVNEAPPPQIVKTVEVKAEAPVHVEKHVDVKTEVHPPFVYKEVFVPRPVVHYKPHHHHHHKSWAGGYFEGGAGVGAEVPAAAPPPPTRVVYKEVYAPVVQKRVDVIADEEVAVHPVGGVGYSKTVNFSHRNPSFFSDIFNIPIQTLSAVGKFLGNAAGSTSVSVEKSGYVHAG